MRGKDSESESASIFARITPAYAGKSKRGGFGCFCRWDHPRLCGEKKTPVMRNVAAPGSPPPMRGKGTFGTLHRSNHWDHPRLCGEKVASCKKNLEKVGSPPPMRGKGSRTKLHRISQRDHPRLCGEKLVDMTDGDLQRGSPPPMRGKEILWTNSHKESRITPAYAGKSIFGAVSYCRRWDHPRLCGEKSPDRIFPDQHQGSPPPMRGKVKT